MSMRCPMLLAYWMAYDSTDQLLYNNCLDDPVLKAVCNNLHVAIRESCLTLAQVASVAIAAQHHLVLDASTFDCWPLRATLLSIPFVGTSLFG